jgi:DNA replication protein DnaC
MTKTEAIKSHCKKLRLPAIANVLDEMVTTAHNNQVTYLDFIESLFNVEIDHRMEKDKQRRTKQARLP